LLGVRSWRELVTDREKWKVIVRKSTSLREGDHWGDPDVDGRIILRLIFRKWEGFVGTGWSGLRIGTGGGHLWVR
jgi:hypothetical protein